MLMHSCAQERAIATHQKSIDGVITAHEPQNHNRYGYQFFIDGKRHSGWEIPQKTDYKIGQKVDVYYDPQNPDKSSLTNFNELSTRSAGPVPLLLIGVGIVTFFNGQDRRPLKEERVNNRNQLVGILPATDGLSLLD